MDLVNVERDESGRRRGVFETRMRSRPQRLRVDRQASLG
jgi:hypothetical protein